VCFCLTTVEGEAARYLLERTTFGVPACQREGRSCGQDKGCMNPEHRRAISYNILWEDVHLLDYLPQHPQQLSRCCIWEVVRQCVPVKPQHSLKMGRMKKKGKSGIATQFISRTRAVRMRLDLPHSTVVGRMCRLLVCHVERALHRMLQEKKVVHARMNARGFPAVLCITHPPWRTIGALTECSR
jgi:hypothetical protein